MNEFTANQQPLPPQNAPESDFTLQSGLHQFGRKRALDSGTTELLESDEKALEEHASAMARQLWRPAYDPASSPYDAAQEDRFVAAKTERGEALLSLKHKESNLRDAERGVALVEKAGEKPSIPTSVLAAITGSIAISAASVIHDKLAGGMDNMLAWLFATLGSTLVGATLVLGFLWGRGSRWRYLPLTGGIVVGAALFALRWSGAEDSQDQLIAVGLSLLEIGAVLLLEHLMQGLSSREAAWIEKYRIERAKLETRDAAELDVNRAKKALEDVEREIQNHMIMLRDRSHAFSSVDQLEAVAVKAVLDGYGQGIAENRGRIRGTLSAIRRQATQDEGGPRA